MTASLHDKYRVLRLLKNQCLPLVRHLKENFQLLQTQKTVQQHGDPDSGWLIDSMEENLMKALAALEKEDMDTTEKEIINVFVAVHNQMGTADVNLKAALKALMTKGQKILFLGHTGQIPGRLS